MGSNHQVEEDITNILEQHPNWKSVGMGGELETVFLMEENLVQEGNVMQKWLLIYAFQPVALAWSKWNMKRDSMIYVVMKFGLARISVFLLQRLQSLLVLTLT
ncbi:uncharacterized protein LOC126725316 isoform X3 [Quercus robur]|uniref:uncharacterized protein LOC126725316 isoform X3 n=1 Tax=Quercus robur TaxID=38942 RepID=UPI002163156D|nr:uncharacterized protein LOC126725316 isoform X3 [Quercus robur]